MGQGNQHHGHRRRQRDHHALERMIAAQLILFVRFLARLLPGIGDLAESHFALAQARPVHIHHGGAHRHHQHIQQHTNRQTAELQRAAYDHIQKGKHEKVRHYPQAPFQRAAIEGVALRIRLEHQSPLFVFRFLRLILHTLLLPK